MIGLCCLKASIYTTVDMVNVIRFTQSQMAASAKQQTLVKSQLHLFHCSPLLVLPSFLSHAIRRTYHAHSRSRKHNSYFYVVHQRQTTRERINEFQGWDWRWEGSPKTLSSYRKLVSYGFPTVQYDDVFSDDQRSLCFCARLCPHRCLRPHPVRFHSKE